MALSRFFAAQARRPSGIVGRLLIGRLFNRSNARIIDHTIELLGIQPADQVLDVGFGGGLSLAKMAERAPQGRVFGVDLSPEMVQQAARRFRPLIQSGKLDVRVADVGALPFTSGAFDKICTINTIYFWPDPLAALRELRRLLKPGGRLVVAIRSREKMERLKFTRHGFTLYSPEELRQRVEDAGFSAPRVEHRDPQALGDAVMVVAEV